MTDQHIRRHRGLIDDVVGGALTFLLEVAVVVGFGIAALVVAAIVLLLV